MNFLAIIPARGGSKGIPGKNLKPVGGVPLIVHTIRAAKGARHVHRVLVSTRVCIIRHRNFAGEPAYAIVSRGLNRRLLIEALSAAANVAVPRPVPVEAPEKDHQWL